MGEPAIQLEGVGKKYWQLEEQAMLLRSLLPIRRPKRHELWALRDVDLRVDDGETIGILGRNGAGKSTTLRLLAGVTRPTEGTVTIHGRVAPLIGVGVGFHHEMSGRENVYVNGMLLGLTKPEIDARFDDIVAFAELHEFIDTPVKFYSTGMFMRLGFSVAVHVEPSVLLVDEVLAVGDIAFQLKCFERMRALRDSGTTIVLVSHSMAAIRLLCPRAVVFGHGRLEFDGSVEEAIGTHHRLLAARSDDTGAYLHDRADRGAVLVASQELFDDHGRPTGSTHPDEQLYLRAELRTVEAVDTPQVLFVVRGEDGSVVYRAQSAFGQGHRPVEAGQTLTVEIPFSPRFGGGGTYSLELVVTDRDGRDVLGRSEGHTLVYVSPRPGTFGVADLGARIVLDGARVDDHQSLSL